MYKTIKEEVVEKLKFMAKGETKGKPKYGMKILEAMLSQIITESADNMNYLAKSKNTQSGAPIQGMGRGKGYMRKGGLEDNVPKMKKKNDVPRRKRTITVDDNILEDPDQDLELVMSVNLEENEKQEKERCTKARHVALVLDREVNKEVEEGFKEQMKLNFIAESSDDEKTESDDYDVGDDKTEGFGILIYKLQYGELSVTPRQGGNMRRNIMDIITTQWCQQ
ncbi:hypothetical protein Tco_0746713 [Tanacetum coccineum]